MHSNDNNADRSREIQQLKHGTVGSYKSKTDQNIRKEYRNGAIPTHSFCYDVSLIIHALIIAPLGRLFFNGADGGSRTRVSALGRLHNGRYTTPARQRVIAWFPNRQQNKFARQFWKPYKAASSSDSRILS